MQHERFHYKTLEDVQAKASELGVCFYACRLYAFSIFIILLCNYFVIDSRIFTLFPIFAFT